MMKLKDLKLRTKFMVSIGLILLVLTVVDVLFGMWKEKNIMYGDIQKWTFIFAENVRTTLNTLMREGRMDMRFAMLDTMSKEIKGLQNIRIIRGPRVDEIFRKIKEDEVIPREREAINGYRKEISDLEEDLKAARDKDEISDIKDEINSLQDSINSAQNNIEKARVITPVDERERPKDDLDKEVLSKGQPIYNFKGDSARVLVPYIANKTCTTASGCHKLAREGDVLGAISMEFSIADARKDIARNNIETAGIGLVRLGIILGVLSLFLSAFIIKNINKMLEGFKRLTDGDLSVKLPVDSDDEMGKLGKEFNEVINRFNEVIKKIQIAAKEVVLTSQGLSDSSTQIVSGTQSQKEKATQVAAASEELSCTTKEIADNIHVAAEAARGADSAAEKGGQIVTRTMGGMNAILPMVKESSTAIVQLGSRSNEIGKIVEVINNIADQTNLLALNAAIEAARAGEHGKGFAIVADEVRKLADRTTTATKEISEMIKTIQESTEKAIISADSEVKAVKEAVELAKETGGALNDIISHVEKVSKMVQQIASASEQQSIASGQISEDIDAIAAVSRDRVKDMDQIAKAVVDLSGLSSRLEEMTSMFKLCGDFRSEPVSVVHSPEYSDRLRGES